MKWEYDLLKEKKDKSIIIETISCPFSSLLVWMSKEAIPLKTYIFPPYQLLFGAGFFATYPTVLPYPAQDDVLSEHNLKSAGRFCRHCVRFLWRHKTLIDIKPRGYFNFLRLHPPESPSHPFPNSPLLPSTRFIRLTRYVYTPSPSSLTKDTRLSIAPPYLAHNTFAGVLYHRPTFFSNSLQSAPLVGRQISFPSCFTTLFPATLFDDLINPTATSAIYFL